MATKSDWNFSDATKRKAKAKDKRKDVLSVTNWWKVSDALLPSSIMAQVKGIILNDKTRIENYNRYARLYGNRTASSWNGYMVTKVASGARNTADDRMSMNVIQSCIDTLVSKITKSKPKPEFLTSKGDYKLQNKAKKLNKFCTGIFYENNLYNLAPLIFRDACVFGEGILHVYNDHGRVKYERVLPYEILVDYLESHSGPQDAKSMHRLKNMDRDTLAGLVDTMPEPWNSKENVMEVYKIGSTNEILAGQHRSVSDVVTVIESWRLPSSPGADDGLHTIIAEDFLIFKEKYSNAHFPFAVYRYSPSLYGFWSVGLSEQLVPIQMELNRNLMLVQHSLYLGGTYKILMHAGSKIVETHFDNQVGAIIKYAGDVPPQYITPPIVQPELYQQIQTLKEMAYEQSGISSLSATSQKPEGLDSGEAMRTYSNIESDRFQTVGSMYEQFILEVAKISITVTKEIAESGGSPFAKVPGKRFLETIKWKEVSLDDDDYYMQVFPVNKMASDPSGRLSDIQDMMAAGLCSPEQGKRLMDFPDLEAENNLSNAMDDYLHQILEKITENGEYTAPEPEDNLARAEELALEYYIVGKRDNLDSERLDLLLSFISQVRMFKQMQIQQAAPQQAS